MQRMCKSILVHRGINHNRNIGQLGRGYYGDGEGRNDERMGTGTSHVKDRFRQEIDVQASDRLLY